jgi:hypothetical protein
VRLRRGFLDPDPTGTWANSPFTEPRRMRTIGFAPWKPLPPLIDDPEWDVETFAEQAERLSGLPDDDDDEMGASAPD